MGCAASSALAWTIAWSSRAFSCAWSVEPVWGVRCSRACYLRSLVLACAPLPERVWSWSCSIWIARFSSLDPFFVADSSRPRVCGSWTRKRQRLLQSGRSASPPPSTRPGRQPRFCERPYVWRVHARALHARARGVGSAIVSMGESRVDVLCERHTDMLLDAAGMVQDYYCSGPRDAQGQGVWAA